MGVTPRPPASRWYPDVAPPPPAYPVLISVEQSPLATDAVLLTYDRSVNLVDADTSLFQVAGVNATFASQTQGPNTLDLFAGGGWPDPTSGETYDQDPDFLPGVPDQTGTVI